MAKRFKDEDGNIWEVGPNGQPRFVSGGQMSVQTKPADPTIQYAAPKAAADANRAQSEAAISAAQAPSAGTIADAQARKAEADARVAQMAADAEAQARAEANSPEAKREKVRAAREKAQVALRTIDQIRTAIGKPGSSGPVGQIARWVDSTAATDKETAIGALGALLGLDKLMEMKQQSATGASGMGPLSEKEMQVLVDQKGSLSHRQSNPQLLATLRGIEKHFKRFLLANEGVHPDRYEALGIDPFEELDPQTARRRAQDMLRKGGNEEQVGEFLTLQGLQYDPATLKANVGYQGAKVLPPEDAGPHSFVKGLEHVGSRAVSGLEAVPNTVLGTDFNLGDQWHQSLQQRWEGRHTDPAAEMTGRIVGALPAALATRNPFLGGAVENTLVNDSRDPMGIGQDALVGGVLGKGGDMAIRGVAGAIAPNVSQPVRNLHERRVRMTPGQIMGGESVKQEGLRTSLPFAGTKIQRSLDQSYDDVQHAMGDEILSPAGQQADRSIPPGGEFVGHIQDRGSQLYTDALNGTEFQIDPRLGARLTSSLSKHRMRPDVLEEVTSDLQVNLGGMFGNGGPARVSGQQWKAADSDLSALAEHYRKQGASYNPAAKAVRDVRDDLFRGFVRQNPGTKASEVRAADKVHRGVRTLNNAAARDGANNVPSPGQIMGAIKAEAPTGRTAFARGEAPLQQFASDVQNTMPTYANSRSTDRGLAAMVGSKEGAKAHLQGLALAPLYSEPVQRGFQNTMLRQNYTLPKTGDFLRSNATAGARGMFGSAAGRNLLGMDPMELQAMLEEDARLRRAN